MRTFTTVALGLIGLAVASASDVSSLTKETFTDFVSENDLVLVEFFKPGCRHCKDLAPEYEEAATTLKEKTIKLAKVDCTEEFDLCQNFSVKSYPTLKVFRGPENISPYRHARKAPAIVSYMTKQSLPTVSSLTRDSLEGFKTADKVVLVGYFAADDEASIVSFTTVAEMLRHSYLFGVVTDANLAMAEDVSIPSVILYKAFDEGKSIFSHSIDVEAVYKFAITASIPLVGEVLPETHPGYIATGIPLAYIFAETEEERFKLGTALKPVAEKYRSAVIFTTIDAKVFGAYADDLKLQVHKWPAFAIQDTVSNKAFPYDQDAKITAELIGKFVQDFIDGKIEPTIKSEPIPEKQQGPVQVVVAKNYNIIVLDDSKDAIIEFYAPWCNHCKAFAPSYDILAALYTEQGHSEKVTIAKVDATANDIPEEIMDFPTIKLYKAGDKSNPVTYRGNRTIRDLIRFIEESGKHGVSVTYVEEKPAESEARQAEASTESVSKELKESATGATKAEESHDEL